MVAYRNMPRATADEKEHMKRVSELPCCVCQPGWQRSMTQVHHLISGGRRMGHFFVIPLCEWHHQHVHQLAGVIRTHWELVNETLGVKRDWPVSKICQRA